MKLESTLIKLTLLLLILINLNSCGIYRPVSAKDYPPEPEKRVQKNMDEGRGLKLFKNESAGGGVFDFATSNELWRASLDTLDFMPLISADYGGGLIITDWYSEENQKNDFIKISIRFLTNEIRADALKIQIYTKECIADTNNCKITQNNSEIETKLKESILKKASIYKQEKKKKKN